MMQHLIFTISTIRVAVLILWLFYFLFEHNTRRLLFALVIVLMIPNLFAIYMELVGP